MQPRGPQQVQPPPLVLREGEREGVYLGCLVVESDSIAGEIGAEELMSLEHRRVGQPRWEATVAQVPRADRQERGNQGTRILCCPLQHIQFPLVQSVPWCAG